MCEFLKSFFSGMKRGLPRLPNLVEEQIPVSDINEIEVIDEEIIVPKIVMEEIIKGDDLTLKRILTAHPRVRQELFEIYAEINKRLNGRVQVRFSDVYRTFEQQNELYAQGRTKPGKIVTYARGGESNHNYGLAPDVVILIDRDGNGTYETASWNTTTDDDFDGDIDWNEIVHVFRDMYGWQWGFVNSKGVHWDKPHFQKTFGYSIKELQKMPKDSNGYVIFPK